MRYRGVFFKFIMLGCVSILSFVAMGIYGISNTASTFTWVQDVYRTAEDVRRSSEQITIPLNEVRQTVLAIVIAPNPQLQGELNAKQQALTAELDKTLIAWQSGIHDESERKAFQQMQAEWDAYKRLKDYTVTKAIERYREEAFINANGAAREQFQRVNEQLNNWTQVKIDVADKVYRGATTQYGRVLRVSLMVIGVLTLAVGFVGYFTARSIFRPIDVLKDAAARIAKQDFVHDIAVHSHDELDDLARSMETMADAIRTHMARQVDSEAQVRALNAGLERRVEERTVDLERAVGELRVANEAAAAAHEKLVETERRKSAFFANVSHELRTPLTLILAPLESVLAGEYGAITAQARQLLETMHNNAIRLLQMVNGLLDFAKLDAKRLEVKREPIQIVGLTRAILGDFDPLLKRTGIDCCLETDSDEACVSMDRYLYERILFNLLSNALKFTPPGGKITVSIRVADGRLRLTVADTGIGIAEADQGKLFAKFQQLDAASTRRFEGTGLGLALVREFTGLLDGTVSLTSQVGAGSTFTVECLAPPPPSPTTEEADSPRIQQNILRAFDVRGVAPDQGADEIRPAAPKVLIAEDNPELASYIVSLLQDLCRTRVARDGEEALQLTRQWAPDVVLSDVMMPKRDGLSLCKELKANQETAAIPVVLLTALTHREALLKGWEAGANEYLFKPFHPRELVTRIKTILACVADRKRWEQELATRAAELARSNAELEQFAYVASHDLQEPLRKVRAFGEMLAAQAGPALNEQGRDYLKRMQNAASRMQTLIDDLLSYARVTSQAKPFVPVDLAQVAREVVADLETRVKTTGGRVELGELPRVDGDPVQMRQLLQNLIGNALKFHRPEVPPVVCVQGRVVTNGDENGLDHSQSDLLCEITVQDNGIGFEEKYLDRIFAPFQRLHGRGEFEGTGIGLAICRKIAERHGGSITARSKPEQGTTFIVTVPPKQLSPGSQSS